MPDFDTSDYVTAAVVGTLLGVGAALILRRKPPTRRERLMKELKPYRKSLAKNAKRARRRVEHGAEATAEMGGELVGATRDILLQFRKEMAKVVEETREEIGSIVSDQLDDARKSLRKAAKRFN